MTNKENTDPFSATQERRINDIVEGALKKWVASVKSQAKNVLLGFGLFVSLLVGTELVTKADLIRMLHSQLFPPDPSPALTLTFQDSFELADGDGRSASGDVSFYSEKGQHVELFAQITHRFGVKKRRVVVAIDGTPFGSPVEHFGGGFRDISKQLASGKDLSADENYHSVSFSLDDSQVDALTDQVYITCLVYVSRDIE